jgi:PAS domain S-box-containing protein
MKAAGVSFRTILFATIAAVVVPLAALLPFAIHQAFESRAELARETARHLATTAAAAIDQSFVELRRSVEAAATRYDPDAPGEDCARFLATVTALQPDAAYASFGDRNGDVRCSGLPLPPGRGVNVANLPEFQKPITEGVSVVGEPQLGRLPGVHQVMVAAPVRDRGGKIVGVLGMAVSLGVIQRLATSVVRDERNTLSVITPGGTMVAHAPDPARWVDRKVADLPPWREILARAAEPVNGFRLDDVERIAGVARVPSTGWIVVAGLPEAATLAPVRRAAWLSLGLAAGVVLTAVALGTFLARRLSRPVDAIVAAMQRAAAGAPDPRAPESGPREIALIGAEFNRMLAARTRLEAERHEALARAAAHEQRLANTFEAMTEAVGIIGADGRYELTNHAAEQFLGVPRERIIGTRFDDVPWKRVTSGATLLGRDDHPFEQLRRGAPAMRDYEFRVVRADGKARTLSVNAVPLRDAAGDFDGIVITGIDTTERRAAERRLREVIETLAEGLVIIGADGRYELANRAEEELLGVSRERILGARFDAAPFGRAASDGAQFRIEEHPFERLRRGEPPLRNFEFQLVQPGGEVRTVLANAAPLRDAAGEFDGVVATCVDITERKSAEQRLGEYSARLIALSRRVLTVQEEERRAIARELHDELGQVLTAVKVNLQALRRQSGAAGFGPGFEDSLALLDGAIAEVRAISTRLRPAVLDDLGLEAALGSHLERLRSRTEVAIAAEIRLPQRRLDAAVETACFRIAQEAVTNALRHAGARRLDVALGVADGELALAVSDDGRGFDLAAARRRAAQGESAGLSGMEERARLAGGRLEIRTAPGRGTEVRALFRFAEAP